KFKGKDIVNNVAQVSNATNIAPGMYKIGPVTLAPKNKNNRETHIYYLKHTMEQAAILKEIVEQAKSLNPLDSASYSICKYVKLIQELLGYVRDTCPNIYKPSEKLVVVTPINRKKTVRFTRYIFEEGKPKWLNKALDEGPYQFEMFIPNNSTVPKLKTTEDLQGDALLHYDVEMELMNLILLSIPNDIYNSVDACTSAKDMWKRVERLMRGTIQNKVDRETRFINKFDLFVAEPGEALVSVYNHFA
ncbi:hypothetical protein Tco_0115426, partial [Tanacetum coccineum]